MVNNIQIWGNNFQILCQNFKNNKPIIQLKGF